MSLNIENGRTSTIKFSGLIVVLVMLATSVLAKSINPGLWEMSVMTSMSGMNTAMPAQKTQQCITSKDMVPRDTEGCSLTNVKVNNGNVSWDMSCNKQGMNISGSGQLTYNGNSMRGSALLKVKQQGGQALEMKQTYTGKRIGKCKK